MCGHGVPMLGRRSKTTVSSQRDATHPARLPRQGTLMPLQLAGHHRRSNNFGSLTAVPDGRTFSLEARAESWPRTQSQSTIASAPRLVEQHRRSPNIGPSLSRSTPPALRPDVTHFFPHAWLLAAQEATEQTSERDRRNSPLPMQLSLIFLFVTSSSIRKKETAWRTSTTPLRIGFTMRTFWWP